MIYPKNGDPVWLPQGTLLSRNLEKYGIPDIRFLEMPERAILLETHPAKSNMKKVYLSSGAWWVDESEIKPLIGEKYASEVDGGSAN